MKVREVLENSQQLIGHQLTIEGGLVIQFDRGYICPDIEELRNENESIFIRDYQRLASRFSYIVSSFVGSNVRYRYWASITGTLSQSSLEPFAIDLINITDMVLTDEREKYVYKIDRVQEDFDFDQFMTSEVPRLTIEEIKQIVKQLADKPFWNNPVLPDDIKESSCLGMDVDRGFSGVDKGYDIFLFKTSRKEASEEVIASFLVNVVSKDTRIQIYRSQDREQLFYDEVLLIAVKCFKEALKDYIIPKLVKKTVQLRANRQDIFYIFEVYIPGEGDEDELIVSRIKVEVYTGSSTVEMFLEKAPTKESE